MARRQCLSRVRETCHDLDCWRRWLQGRLGRSSGSRLDSRSIAIDVVDGISVVLDSENPPEILCIDVPIRTSGRGGSWGARVRQSGEKTSWKPSFE